jgi:hypothetical protein
MLVNGPACTLYKDARESGLPTHGENLRVLVLMALLLQALAVLVPVHLLLALLDDASHQLLRKGLQGPQR